jgi:hypothetical protein
MNAGNKKGLRAEIRNFLDELGYDDRDVDDVFILDTGQKSYKADLVELCLHLEGVSFENETTKDGVVSFIWRFPTVSIWQALDHRVITRVSSTDPSKLLILPM